MQTEEIERELKLRMAPQISTPKTTQTIMRDVLIALAPACVVAVVLFGVEALVRLAVSVICCMAAEWAWCRLRGTSNTVYDLSAAVTGVLLAMNVPSTIPLYMLVLGDLVAIIAAKELFGGIGRNFCNPAVVGRIFLALAFPVAMTTFAEPSLTIGTDLVSQATPLARPDHAASWVELLLGTHTGTLGETCAFALIIGGVYLLVTRTISWHTPVAYLGTVAVCSLIAGQDVVFELLSGGLMLGAWFMATDYATTPTTKRGKVVFAIGCGLITCLIRFFGNLNEGVAYSILFMNLLVPHIDSLTANVPLGAENMRKKGGDRG